MIRHKSSGLVFKTKPWNHQLKALQFLMATNRGALYTDMGTGKTKVLIDLINNKKFNTCLIVCPINVCSVWVKEFAKHSVGEYKLIDLSKYSSVEKVSVMKEVQSSRLKNVVFICNYDSVWREPFKKLVLKSKFDAVICDESHRIKTPSAKVSRFLALLTSRCENRYLLTGTPLAQAPPDIYSQYKFLDPSIFGTNLRTFKDRYENLDIFKTSKVGYRVLDKNNPYKNLDELQRKMFSVAINVESDVVLPETQDIFIEFDIPSKVNKILNDLRKESVYLLENTEFHLEVKNVLALAVREQQLMSGFLQLQDLDGNKKLEKIDNSRETALKELLYDMNPSEPLVIFSKYVADMDVIKSVLTSVGRSYSEISGSKRELQDWVEAKTNTLIVQIQSGSEGIDLTHSRYVIYYTQTWSLAQYKQSRKRVHRPGQNKSVTYYHLVAKLPKGRSIDQKIYFALETNSSIIDLIMSNE